MYAPVWAGNEYVYSFLLQVILVPSSVMETCLLLGTSLSEAELEQCKRISSRSYNLFATPPKINILTGANAVDIAQLGIDQALLTKNTTLLAEAYQNARGELKVVNTVQGDGIRNDGAFGKSLNRITSASSHLWWPTAQHKGVLYNGNYGMGFSFNATIGILHNGFVYRKGLVRFSQSAFQTQCLTGTPARMQFSALKSAPQVLHSPRTRLPARPLRPCSMAIDG